MADNKIDTTSLEDELIRLETEVSGSGGTIGTTDTRAMKLLVVLGKAIWRLDTTSARLARVNIALTGVILIVGILQAILMIRGH